MHADTTDAVLLCSLQAASAQKWDIDLANQGLKDEAEKAIKAAAALQGVS